MAGHFIVNVFPIGLQIVALFVQIIAWWRFWANIIFKRPVFYDMYGTKNELNRFVHFGLISTYISRKKSIWLFNVILHVIYLLIVFQFNVARFLITYPFCTSSLVILRRTTKSRPHLINRNEKHKSGEYTHSQYEIWNIILFAIVLNKYLPAWVISRISPRSRGDS